MSDLDDMLKALGIADEAGEYVDPTTFRSGFVTLVGRPNAGKSSLINAVMGKKLAITSNMPQTTRHRFRAVYDSDDMQMVMVDTPGLHKPDNALGIELNESALQALGDVDVVAMLIDCSKPVGKGDAWVAGQLSGLSCKKVLVISKMDLGGKRAARAQLARARGLADWDAELAVSSRTGYNVETFVETIYGLLPNGPRWFPKGTGIDQPDEVIVAEFIREKVLRNTREEVPHAVGVTVEQIDRLTPEERGDEAKRPLWKIWAVIYVERTSQKGIIIGHKGSMIKRVGTEARADLERLFGVQIHLDLTVKVKKDWRNDASQIRKFGYGEGL